MTENPAPSNQFDLRLPSTANSSTPSNDTFNPPSLDWLKGTWHVTHSTLPMWKSKSDVTITYTPLPSNKLDDFVEYRSGHPSPTNPSTKPKPKSVHGISTPTPGQPGAFDWRGRGWLMIASSHWEVLGWGSTAEGRDWVVTYFAKTLFTPAGVDVYSRGGEGLGGTALEGIKEAMVDLGKGEGEFGKLVEGLFEIKRDQA
ncbi:MAG: hypothetical protein Q9227_003155 [Pyrenula ochraceoflavens]